MHEQIARLLLTSGQRGRTVRAGTRELPDQVFAGAREPLHARARELILERRDRQRARPARVEDLDRLDRPALEMGRELATDRLDLR